MLYILREITLYHPKLYLIYTLHLKLLKCTFCALNYPCYTLHPDVKFAVNLDGKI